MTVERPECELSMLVWWGRWLMGTSVGSLALGGAIVKIVPGLNGRGLDDLTLSILIPIWAMGIAGILLLLMGWILYPALDTDQDRDLFGLDRRSFGRLTKSLALLAAALLWLGSLGLLLDPTDPTPLWTKGLLCYGTTCYCGWVFYLVVFYINPGHYSTTSYQSLLTPMIAFVLVPLTWPLLIVLNCVVIKRNCDAANRAESDEFTGQQTQ